MNTNLEAGQPTETQRAEVAANTFYDLAERQPETGDTQARELFATAGRETAQGNYNLAQRSLESVGQWDDKLRGSASEINQLDGERIGAEPMSFAEAQNAMGGLARGFEEISTETGGTREDRKSALMIEEIVGGTSRPGIDGIDTALQYIEGTLKTRAESDRPIKPEERVAVQEKRAIRDALYREKQERIEKQQQSRQQTESRKEGQGSVAKNLENLYDQAGVPGDTTSRQDFLTRVGVMSETELHLLDAALEKTATEFGRSQDPKLLDGLLMDMSTKSYNLKDVKRRQEADDQRQAAEILAKFGQSMPDNVRPSGQEEPATTGVTETVVPNQVESSESEKARVTESPEERLKKFQNYEAHKNSAEKIIKSLQETKNLVGKNDMLSTFMIFEATIPDLTLRASSEDIKGLRGKPVDLQKERSQFEIKDQDVDDYVRMREAQNFLSDGKSVKEVTNTIERQLGEAYGVTQIDLSTVHTRQDTRKFDVNLIAEETDNPALVDQVKEVRGVGYHIPNVPQYNVRGEIIGTSNRGVKAKPGVVVYRAKI